MLASGGVGAAQTKTAAELLWGLLCFGALAADGVEPPRRGPHEQVLHLRLGGGRRIASIADP